MDTRRTFAFLRFDFVWIIPTSTNCRSQDWTTVILLRYTHTYNCYSTLDVIWLSAQCTHPCEHTLTGRRTASRILEERSRLWAVSHLFWRTPACRSKYANICVPARWLMWLSAVGAQGIVTYHSSQGEYCRQKRSAASCRCCRGVENCVLCQYRYVSLRAQAGRSNEGSDDTGWS